VAVERLWVGVGGRSVRLHVLELGLACCGIEVRQARRVAQELGTVLPGPDISPPGPGDAAPGGGAPPGGAGAADLNVLVVAGTVSARLAPVLVEEWSRLPEPRAVLAFGACAATGGPYWDSYSVVPGAHELVDVDVWVAGCPPRPADLVAGLEEVLRGRP